MNKQSYLDSKQLQTECNECIKILKSELLEIEKVSNNIKLVLNETGLKGEAMEAYKKQLKRYFEIFVLMKEADKFDIIDYSKLKAEATKTYDGDLICSSYERAKNDRDRYQSKANDERSKAASFNTTVTTLLPGGKVLVEHIPNPYESSAREYQNLADDCQKEMNLWHSKMEEFDAIEARTAGLFVAGKNKRTIARMKLRTINKTPISGLRTRSGGGTGGLISYIPDTPKTTINEDVLKGAKMLEEELRKMKNEDGTPKYTEQEIKEMVEYVIKKHPSDLVALFNVSDQFKTQQMDLCKQYAIDSKKMIPIDRGADLFANYLRNLTNEDGTPMYTEEEIEAMVAYVLEHHPSSLSTLYYAPSQYYRYAAEQCLEYANEMNMQNYVIHARVGTASDPMSQEEINENAEYIYNYLRGKGWSKEAICAVLGNIYEESKFNPGVWERLNDGSSGYGILQFTAYNGVNEFFEYIRSEGYESIEDYNELIETDPKKMLDYQLEFLLTGTGWYSSSGFSRYFTPLEESKYADLMPDRTQMSFSEFMQSDAAPEALALIFEASYERSADDLTAKEERGASAGEWYEYFADYE